MLGILIVFASIISMLKNTTSLSIIGEDGPTAIFIAGEIGEGLLFSSLAIGITFIIIGCICLFYRRKW